LRELLAGQQDAYRDIVLFGTGAALVIADKADSVADGVKMAAQAIDSGQAAATLEKLVAMTNS